MTDVRLAAARLLLALEEGQTTLAAELEHAREGIDDRRDRGLLIEIASGTVRWRAELDRRISIAGNRPISTIEPAALAVLRLGAYQLCHLDRVPAHAVVNESVEVIRALGAPRAAGFVNALLRGLLRQDTSAALPARPGASQSDAARIEYLSTTLSHPEWLVRRWLSRYGFEATERWCQFNNSPPDITVRSVGRVTAEALLEQLRGEGLDARPARFVRDAIQLTPGSLGRISAALRDEIVVQDEGSQLVARYAGARPGEHVLDVCASPGGKTMVIAADMRAGDPARPSLLVAADRRAGRVSLLKSVLGRAGLAIPIVALDAHRPLPFGPVFDCVLLDAPCSGLGTLRRDPDLKWTRQAADLAAFAAGARRMLASAAEVIGPGGRLIYSTCSSEPDENAAVVESFLASDRRFAVGPGAEGSSALGPPDLLDRRGFLLTEPFRHQLDGFFAATLVRRPSP